MDFKWRPRSIDDTVDAGVHPVVAAMRLAQKGTPEGSGQIVEGMDLKATPWNAKPLLGDKAGYTYNKRNGPASATAQTEPIQQITRLTSLGVNPQDYLKQAKALGLNPAPAGPDLPDRKADKKDKKKDKKSKKKKKKDKKTKKKDKKSKKKKKDKKSKKKKDKKKDSSSSSGSSSSSSSDS
eukprot:CAMPEP_0178429824 /NCGR_PEP_ID=MMETSP0689_2-20121128/31004_1 /TAXON_ID=160604 /ORGANISM="Amphidinium massartii, Strain CS-259" /LENGTH=180 /DNA_ID=CAMNT_0020051663 /DNA_START=1 /DNA_END=539 /DNA_ORIENTATION=-